MTTEAKHISTVVDGILSNCLEGVRPLIRAGRLAVPLDVVDNHPVLMRRLMRDIDLHRTYRAKNAATQYYWGTSKEFDLVDPFQPRQFYTYELQYLIANGEYYYTFSRTDAEEELSIS